MPQPTPSFTQKLKNAYQAYQNLSPQQRKIIKDKRLSGNFRLQTWRDTVEKIIQFDEAADQIRSTIGTIAGAGLGITFFFSVLGLAFGLVEFEILLYLTIAWNLLVTPLWVLGLVLFFVLKNLDVPNTLRLVAMPFLEKVAPELDPQARIPLEMDLGKKARKDNLIRKEQNYKPSQKKKIAAYSLAGSIVLGLWGGFLGIEALMGLGVFCFFVSFFAFVLVFIFSGKYPKIKTTWHEVKALSLKLLFENESDLALNITEEVAKKRISVKERRNGKTVVTTYTEYSLSHHIEVNWRFPVGKFEFEKEVEKLPENLHFHQEQKGNDLCLSLKTKTQLADIQQVVDLELFLTWLEMLKKRVVAV